VTQSFQHPPQGTVRDWLDKRATSVDAAFVFSDGSPHLTWRELRDEARRIAAVISTAGADKSESIALLQPNGREAIITFFGAIYGGYRATMINLIAGSNAINYALEHSEARFAFVHETAEQLFSKTSASAQILKLDPSSDAISPLHELDAKDHALLMYTSGTTGLPKGVVHTHASVLAGGWTTTIAHELTSSDRALCVLPVYHINGLCVSVMSTLISGGSAAMCPKFSASQFWHQAEELKATWFSVVPTIISHLLHGIVEPSSETKNRLRFGRSASSALAPDVQSGFESRFDVPIIETMGLTETAAQILSNPLPPATRKIGSPGIQFGNEIEIRTPSANSAAADEEGEIVVKGPNLMEGYFKNHEVTASSKTADGWLKTGDLGRKDKDGFVFVTGRLKELIIKGGENIAPREVDEALYSHGDVVEAAAFARPCKNYGERIEAAVSLKKGSSLTATELVQICTDKLGSFKSPAAIHFLSELPKGPSGKIQRLKLCELTPSTSI